jgi:hypothetical protein
MKNYKLIKQPSFWLAFVAMLLGPVWAPSYPIYYYLPALVIICYKTTHFNAISAATCCGVLIDLFSQSFKMGLHTLPLTLTLLIGYPLKTLFFEDRFSTLPVLTFIFSILCSLFSWMMAFLFSGGLSFSKNWLWTDALVFGFYDALYGLVFFAIPFYLTRQLSKIRQYALIWKKDR